MTSERVMYPAALDSRLFLILSLSYQPMAHNLHFPGTLPHGAGVEAGRPVQTGDSTALQRLEWIRKT